MKRTDAEALIAAIIKLREGATDSVASTSVIAYPTLKNSNKLVRAGTRINHKGRLLRASVDLWDTAENNPDNAPGLWEAIQYRDGIRIIPERITVGTAFNYHELGWWGDVVYRSLLETNVYTPDQYQLGWEIYELKEDA